MIRRIFGWDERADMEAAVDAIGRVAGEVPGAVLEVPVDVDPCRFGHGADCPDGVDGDGT